MPELPEVQTIADELKKKIVGLKITDVWVDWEKTVRQAGGIEKFKKEISGKKILSVRRRAKYIIIDIEGKKTIFIHQKISGHLLYGKWSPYEVTPAPNGAGRRPLGGLLRTGWAQGKVAWTSQIKGPLQDDNRNKYIRAIFFLNNGYQVGFSDLRRFGKIILVDDEKVGDLKEIRELGPEPLEIKLKDFLALFDKKRGRLKQVLMDPTFIAGIGNIYSDEILWDSGYHPLTKNENLDEKDITKIYKSIKKILAKAIKYKGDSIDDYRLPSGEKGGYQNVQNAYHETNNKCKKKDGGIIKRIKVGGRSAHFCPVHQILK